MHYRQSLFGLLVAVILFSGCKGCEPKPAQTSGPEPASIAELKKLKPGEKLLDKDYEVTAYFTHDPVPMLVSDMKWTQINTPMPDSVFIQISGPAADSMAANPDRYFGAEIRLKGRVGITPSLQNKEILQYDFRCPELPELLKPRRSDLIIPVFFDLCRYNPRLCDFQIQPISGKVAILYSGGYNSSNAHSRYWNDLKFMYKTLKSNYGYTDDNIIVVYKDGVAADAQMTVDYPASTAGLSNAVNDARTRLAAFPLARKLFVFTTNHGGGNHPTDGNFGVADTNSDEAETSNRTDEVIYYYNMASNTISDDDFAAMINSINATTVISVHEPCFSGGLLRDLRGANRVGISAATEFEYSWSGAPGDHDMFSYHFTAALNKSDIYGTAVNADTDGNGKVSLLEAFLYAKSRDTASESPQLDDNGDGVSTNSPTATGADGLFASKTYL